MMTLDKFKNIANNGYLPVVLVEGTRDLPESDAEKLVAFGKWLAETFPAVIFRTGNAKGSDEAFASGVRSVEPSRLQYVVPYTRHRQRPLGEGSYTYSLSDATLAAEETLAGHTIRASAHYRELLEKRTRIPALRAKAGYLLRDTLKVVGSDESGLTPAKAGIFYVNPEDPMKGGTGHTIRVCQDVGVPVAFQNEWMKWGDEKSGVRSQDST
ncbi:MAG: hypothetical protein U1E27_06040 [Kiritimatiellia bacterium]|nr:hypothetical protein [Kiritimatiellia bacterium]